MSSLDLITAKSWFYCTPDFQYGKKKVIQDSKKKLNVKSHH